MSELKPCPVCGAVPQQIGTLTMYGETPIFPPAIWATSGTKRVKYVQKRTCHQVNNGGYSFRFECSACGCVAIVHNCAVRLDELPNWCPNCGAKVVEE